MSFTRNFKVAIALAGIASALVVGVMSLSAANGPAVRSIRLFEREVQTNEIDLGARGLSQGDRHTITSDMFDANGKRVGRADFDCSVTSFPHRAGGLCHGILSLSGGQLAGEFFWGASGDAVQQAITGGTGEYVGARGQFVVGQQLKTGLTPVRVELVR